MLCGAFMTATECEENTHIDVKAEILKHCIAMKFACKPTSGSRPPLNYCSAMMSTTLFNAMQVQDLLRHFFVKKIIIINTTQQLQSRS